MPSSRTAYVLRAWSAEKKGDYTLAIEYYQIALLAKGSSNHSDEYIRKQIEKIRGLRQKRINGHIQ